MSGMNVGKVNLLPTVVGEAGRVLDTVKAQEATDEALRAAQAKQKIETVIEEARLERQKYLEGEVTAIRPNLQETLLASAKAGNPTIRLFELPVTYGYDSFSTSWNDGDRLESNNKFLLENLNFVELKTGVETLGKLSSECPMFEDFLKELIDAKCKVDVESVKSRFGQTSFSTACYAYSYGYGYSNDEIEKFQRARAYLILTLPTSS